MLEAIGGIFLGLGMLGIVALWDLWRHRKAKHTH